MKGSRFGTLCRFASVRENLGLFNRLSIWRSPCEPGSVVLFGHSCTAHAALARGSQSN